MASRVTYSSGKLTAYISALPAKADRLAEAIARRVEAGAKQRAPVDTGALRGSIAVENAGPGKRIVLAGVEYAYFVEFGTWKMPASPFMYPAVTATAQEVPALAKVILAP